MSTATSSTIAKDIWNLPNFLTFGRIALIPVVCLLLVSGSPIDCVLATVLFGLAGFTDWLDGYLARRMGLVSMTGKFLDPLADKLLVMAVLVTLIPLGRVPAWFTILLLARETTVTGLRALAAGEGMIIAAGRGGKAKTAFQIVGLVCTMLHYQYTLDYGLFELTVRFHHVGFAMLLISLVLSYTSGFEYFMSFVRAIEPTQSDAADAADLE